MCCDTDVYTVPDATDAHEYGFVKLILLINAFLENVSKQKFR